MAEKCLRCGDKLRDNEETVPCPQCATRYHKICFEFMLKCSNCGWLTPIGERFAEEEKKEHEEAEKLRQNAERFRIEQENLQQKAIQERFNARINNLKAQGKTGYYEYKVISLVDKRGSVDINRLMNELNDLGLDGWRLQCAYTNEMGKDSLSIAGFGINATADQNILILERFVSIV